MSDDYEELAYEATQLLVKLAQRNDPEAGDWYRFNHITGLMCNICNQKVIPDEMKKSITKLSANDSVDKIEQIVNEHGMCHLEDSNLLPFI